MVSRRVIVLAYGLQRDLLVLTAAEKLDFNLIRYLGRGVQPGTVRWRSRVSSFIHSLTSTDSVSCSEANGLTAFLRTHHLLLLFVLYTGKSAIPSQSFH
jgi:hypothetical protein